MTALERIKRKEEEDQLASLSREDLCRVLAEVREALWAPPKHWDGATAEAVARVLFRHGLGRFSAAL